MKNYVIEIDFVNFNSKCLIELMFLDIILHNFSSLELT